MMGEGGAGASTASSSGGGGNGGEGNGEERIARRKPSWRERENNRRRERRRRAVSAKIYAGLRAQGNYTLPKHCDNNEVLKALCAEAGWIVEPDGTTYRKGCRMEMGGNSANITPSSSRNGSPPPSSYFSIPSYQPSPSLSPSSSSFLHNHNHNNYHYQFPFRISNSAPVTPPLASPSRLPLDLVQQSMSALNVPFFAASAPASPRRFKPPTIPECDESHIDSDQWTRFQAYINASNDAVPTTFNVAKTSVERAIMLDKGKGAVKAWEGEMIHEVGMEDEDLELTLGSSSSSAKFKH